MSGPRPAPPSLVERLRRSPRTAAWAGPALIALSVLIVLHGFWLEGHLSNQQVDILAFWMPRWSALGDALRHGHLLTWLPNQFGGVPFASDPQSGWLYLPVMVLFSVLSAARAMEWFIVLQPILAGLGLYWFFRHEGLGRPAATFGGLALALAMAGSGVALSMPFAGTLAWSALTLAGASGFLHARTPLALGGWLAFTGFAWTQIAAAHLTDGLLLGTAVLGLYVLGRLIADVRAGERTWRWAVAAALGVFAVLPFLSAAAWLPRLALLPRTSIGLGYRQLGHLQNQLTHRYSLPPLAIRGEGPWWATGFARGPGGYLGAAAILLVPVAFASRRWRWPAGAFALGAVAGWALNLDRLIASKHVRALALKIGVGELWLRDPSRFRYLVLLGFAVLAGYGLQAWLDMADAADRRAALRRLRWLAPAFVVFVLGPLAFGSPPVQYLLFAAGAAYGVPLLVLAARGRTWAPAALAGLLAVELIVGGIVGQYGPPVRLAAQGLTLTYDPGLDTTFAKLRLPHVDAAAYLTPGPIGRALIAGRGSSGRYLSFDEPIAKGSSRGFLSHQDPLSWPAYENGRSILFGLEEIQGYSPVQLTRYWKLVRAANTVPIFYNSATFQSANPALLRLFGVRWLIAPAKQALPPAIGPGGGPVPLATEGSFTLYAYPDAEPRASLVSQVRRAPADGGLESVLQPGFDPAVEAVLDGPPPAGLAGSSAQPSAGTARYRQLSPEHARVSVSSNGPGLLVIRNPYDPNWHATVDGRPVPLHEADYLMQGVVVPDGAHVVDLTYRDPMIGVGLLASALSWAAVLGALGWLWLRRRRARPHPPEEAAGREPVRRTA